MTPLRSPKLMAWHLDRSAFVYIRQSTPQQVLDHQESTARQYALAGRAAVLGWTADRITTIDNDLGRSGQSIEGRPGFQRLLAEVALDHVGLILGQEDAEAGAELEDDFERWRRTAPGRLSPEDEDAIRNLAGDLPAVWHASTTTPAERQRIARLLVERVDVELHWSGGPVESHTLSRPVRRYDLRADYPRMVARVRAWCSDGLSIAGIAERLNEEGFQPPKRADRFPVYASFVRRLRPG